MLTLWWTPIDVQVEYNFSQSVVKQEKNHIFMLIFISIAYLFESLDVLF